MIQSQTDNDNIRVIVRIKPDKKNNPDSLIEIIDSNSIEISAKKKNITIYLII